MLYETVKKRNEKEKELKLEKEKFQKIEKQLKDEIEELKRHEGLEQNNIDLDKVKLAESVILVQGNPYGETSDVTKFKRKPIVEHAIIDIANGCPYLKRQFYGNKRYEGFYQRTDCDYGMGPRHGSIVDRIELKVRDRELTDDEKDACIYYLKNYQKIKQAKESV